MEEKDMRAEPAPANEALPAWAIPADTVTPWPPAGPWRRFFARCIDMGVFGLSMGLLTGLALAYASPRAALWLQRPEANAIFGLMLVPLTLLAEAAVFAACGTTLGKGLLAVRVLDIRGVKPTALQYLRRQLGVYWAGLGLAFPLVTLFTMLSQYSNVNSRRAAGYDSGRFMVVAPPLGTGRAVLAVAMVVTVLGVNGYFEQMAKASDRAYRKGFTWTNQVTAQHVEVPRGWTHEEHRGDKQSYHVFSSPQLGVQLVLAHEELPATVDMENYSLVWLDAVRDSMTLYRSTEPVVFNDLPAMRLLGNLAGDKRRKVNATLLQNGRRFWRIVIVALPDRDPAAVEAIRLRQLLLLSLA